MEKIKVKNESRPQRCEICHQSDLFDPANNVCSRCNSLQKTLTETPITQSTKPTSRIRDGVILGLILHLIQIPMFLAGPSAFLLLGLSQLIYMVPAIAHQAYKKDMARVKGLLLVTGFTFLLTAACWGLILFMLSRSHH